MEQYDLVLLNGRVMDPETGRDLIGNVGIADGKIAAIEAERLIGKEVMDVHQRQSNLRTALFDLDRDASRAGQWAVRG